MNTNTTLITYEESFNLPYTGDGQEEIVEGQLRKLPPASFAHNDLLEALDRALETQITTGRCQVVRGNLGIRKSPFTFRIPDLMAFRAGFRNRLDNQLYAWETPLLVVECLSPSDRKGDPLELLDDYHSIGTPEIWLIRPEHRLVEVHRKDVSGRIVYNMPLRFADAEIPLDVLWKAWDYK